MHHDRVLRAEGLEPRLLLSKGHPAPAHVVRAEVLTPIKLDGTLTVNAKQASSLTDDSGNMVQMMPVSGVLGGVGKVKGFWVESVSSADGSVIPDALQLHNAQGSIVVSFSTVGRGKAHPTATGTSYNVLNQSVQGGSRAYAHVTESGLIAINTNASGKVVQSMTLATKPA